MPGRGGGYGRGLGYGGGGGYGGGRGYGRGEGTPRDGGTGRYKPGDWLCPECNVSRLKSTGPRGPPGLTQSRCIRSSTT